eukprot:scaffold4131_cov83-Isochrysis_galbana.AAC.3
MTHIAKGDVNRVVAAMQMNPRSSRGHGIVALHIIGEDNQPYGRLTLCDLAGMESSKKSAAVDTGPSALAVRKEEAKRINVRHPPPSQDAPLYSPSPITYTHMSRPLPLPPRTHEPTCAPLAHPPAARTR